MIIRGRRGLWPCWDSETRYIGNSGGLRLLSSYAVFTPIWGCYSKGHSLPGFHPGLPLLRPPGGEAGGQKNPSRDMHHGVHDGIFFAEAGDVLSVEVALQVAVVEGELEGAPDDVVGVEVEVNFAAGGILGQ